MPAARVQQVSYFLAAGVLFFVLHFHLLSALLAGLLVYELAHIGGRLLERRLSSQRAKLLVIALLAIGVAGLVAAAIMAIVALMRDENSLSALAIKMAEVLESSRRMLPGWEMVCSTRRPL